MIHGCNVLVDGLPIHRQSGIGVPDAETEVEVRREHDQSLYDRDLTGQAFDAQYGPISLFRLHRKVE